jgi:peptidoglycan/xylan/chitin deacetylase (PgdA/CDA1 family)
MRANRAGAGAAVALALALALAAALFAVAPGPAGAATARPAPAPARTVVTFAWGGGSATQTQALPIFRRYGMHATFFIPSGLVCQRSSAVCARTSPYLTRPDLRKIAADGNEIGGLTVLHQQLNTVPAAEAKREVCDDRSNLLRWGLRPTDFAYPFGVESPAIEKIVRQCGYRGGLGAGQLRGAGKCLNCAWAETIPPRDPLEVRAPIEINSVGTRWSVRTYQSLVRGAQAHGGGWVIFTIHDVCARTCTLGVTAGELAAVLRWLHRQRGNGVSVETMHQVIGGSLGQAVAGPAPAPLPAAGVRNAALAAKAGTGYPVCFQGSVYGRNATTFRYQPHGGPHGMAAETIRVTNWASGDAKLQPLMDLGSCAPPVGAGRSYAVTAQYRATLPTQFDLYYRTSAGAWQYWTTSPAFPASSAWAKASWTTPAVPAGATALSFGLAAESNGTVATTGYSLTPVRDYRPLILLGVVAAVLIGAGLITRGHVRYKRYLAAQAAAAAPAAAGGAGPDPAQAQPERATESAESTAPGGQPGT